MTTRALRSFPPGAPAAHPAVPDYRASVVAALVERRHSLATALGELVGQAEPVAELAATLVATLRAGGKALVAGNGGSAAEAQHFATELVGRFRRERAALPAVALTADTAILTAVANDYGYSEVFARQVRALGQPGDVLLAFSTSGESENLIRAAAAAHERGLTVAALTGRRQSRLARLADVVVRAPSADTPLAQELHVVLLHLLCDIVEEELAGDGEGAR